ncbi:hypothetical protein J6590_013693 [Homalodisca vitripennis]|nr:hypothetical protein J6590_013693 [Homalodisca vitripennis]
MKLNGNTGPLRTADADDTNRQTVHGLWVHGLWVHGLWVHGLWVHGPGLGPTVRLTGFF